MKLKKYVMSLTREQLEQKFKENSITAQDFDKILQDQNDAEKYGQLNDSFKILIVFTKI